MREALRVWQSFYCDGMYARCERYKLAEMGGAVPQRLLPNGRLQPEPTVTPVPSQAVARHPAGDAAGCESPLAAGPVTVRSR